MTTQTTQSKKHQRIQLKIESNKEVLKDLNKVSHYELERFIEDGIRYIKAIQQGRMINCIGSVSSSGMSRTIKFMECGKGKYNHNYLNFFAFFKGLGYNPDNNGYSRISGCGMDMIFYTNYTIIHRLQRLGFISKKQCSKLAQQTPQTI